MKVFENKSILKKIIIVLLCILLLSFCIPKSVDASDGKGGKLLNPVMSLIVGLGDGAMSLLEKIVLQNNATLINIDTSSSWIAKIIVFVASIAVLTVAILSVIATAGWSLTVTVGIGIAKTVITIGTVATITFPVTTTIVEGMLPDSFYLPLYSITPEEIFSNKVQLLDVDFFNPNESKVKTKYKYETQSVKVIDKKIEELKNNHGFTSIDETYLRTETDISGYPCDNHVWEYNGYKYQLMITSRISWGIIRISMFTI